MSSISMYQASVPVFARSLRALSTLLEKGEQFATANGLSPADLIDARLAPDMYTLAGQIQAASDSAKSGAARLAGMPPPSFPDTETTFAELQTRIAKTQEFIQSVTAAQIDGSESREIVMKVRSGEMKFVGQEYLLGFVLPNFFFHVTTAYDILRHKGVPVGKRDFLGA